MGDQQTVACLEVSLREEVRHVAIGTRWFRHLCRARGLDPDPTFAALLAEHGVGVSARQLNMPAREAAGFSDSELEMLSGP